MVGIDIHADYDCGGVSLRHHVFRVRRIRNGIGKRAIREFKGVVGDDQGVFVTTSWLQRGAGRLAESGRVRIAVVDDDQLAEFLIETELDVRRSAAENLTYEGFAGVFSPKLRAA